MLRQTYNEDYFLMKLLLSWCHGYFHFTLLIIPPLSTTLSAPTKTISTFSMTCLNNNEINITIMLSFVLEFWWTQFNFFYPTAASKIKLQGIPSSSKAFFILLLKTKMRVLTTTDNTLSLCSNYGKHSHPLQSGIDCVTYTLKCFLAAAALLKTSKTTRENECVKTV